MNLRLEAILKKEKSLYKDITDELKGKKFAKLNPGLEKTIAMLLERKQLIEQLNKEVLEDAEREALYKSIEYGIGDFYSRSTCADSGCICHSSHQP